MHSMAIVQSWLSLSLFFSLGEMCYVLCNAINSALRYFKMKIYSCFALITLFSSALLISSLLALSLFLFDFVSAVTWNRSTWKSVRSNVWVHEIWEVERQIQTDFIQSGIKTIRLAFTTTITLMIVVYIFMVWRHRIERERERERNWVKSIDLLRFASKCIIQIVF